MLKSNMICGRYNRGTKEWNKNVAWDAHEGGCSNAIEGSWSVN